MTRTAAIAGNGGDYKKIYLQAEDYFVNENYVAALPLYMKLDSMDQGNPNLHFKIGICYLKSPTYKTNAIPYLEDAVQHVARLYEEGEIKERKAPMSSTYYLAKAYHLNYEFDKAIEMYQRYITDLGTDPKFAKEIADVNHDIETCNFGKELVKAPKTMIVENLGDGINTKYPEYSPVVSLDEQTLIFTTRRKGGTTDKLLPTGEYFEDIFVSTYDGEKWGKAVSIGKSVNSQGHEATINLSADGQKLFIYKDDGGNGNIYISELKGSEWGPPEYASAPINSSSWESHACLSSDNRVLYFVSDRPGGYGGRDIYKCLKLPNGEWGPAQNLGDVINTKYDEDGVFIHPDGKQIFFSSKGHNSMGGFDIFTSIVDDENGYWSPPVNYGYPVNTTDDDVFLITTADGKRAFFSSDKPGGFGEKDIYMIKFPENEPRDISILLGKLQNNSSESISGNKIYLLSTDKNDTLQVLTANSSSGKFGANLPVGKSYKAVFTMNGKEFHSEILDAPKGKGYQVIRIEVPYYGDSAAIAGRNGNNNSTGALCDPKAVFQLNFKYNKKEIDESAADFAAFIDRLSSCIRNNPDLVISIESSASRVPTSTFRSNENLAGLRGKAAREKVTKALRKKGIKEKQIVFSETDARVQGPEYNKDAAENMATYEQFQYIKVKAAAKK
ncbi:MAG: hypothetical protein ACJ77K_07190 [Bacteroidia bacterium]